MLREVEVVKLHPSGLGFAVEVMSSFSGNLTNHSLIQLFFSNRMINKLLSTELKLTFSCLAAAK